MLPEQNDFTKHKGSVPYIMTERMTRMSFAINNPKKSRRITSCHSI
jgi:hypothetical protein